MKKKIIGILLFTLLIAAILIPVTITANTQTKQYLNEYNDLETYSNTPTDFPGLITIKIVAKVKDILDQYNLLGGAIQVDDTINGKYIYDSGTPDSEPDPHVGIYEYTSSIFGIEIKAGGFVFKTNPSHVIFGFEILNNFYQNWDGYILCSGENLQLSNGMIVDSIQWQLFDPTGNALSSDALPSTAPVLSDWDQMSNNLFIIGWDSFNPSKSYTIDATVTKVTKSRTRDVYFTSQPILNWVLERFQNLFPILRYLMKL